MWIAEIRYHHNSCPAIICHSSLELTLISLVWNNVLVSYFYWIFLQLLQRSTTAKASKFWLVQCKYISWGLGWLYLIRTNGKVIQQNLHTIAFRSCRWYKFKHIRLCLNNMGPSLYRLCPVRSQCRRNSLRSFKEQYFLNMKNMGMLSCNLS